MLDLFKKDDGYSKKQYELNLQALEELREDYAALEQRFKAFKASLVDDTRKGPFKLNFYTMNAFSIERNLINDRPATIVGYKIVGENGQEQVKEWYLHTSEEAHQKIVEDFEDYMRECDTRRSNAIL